MRLLSRVAERLYWMARYMERAEDTARLTKTYTHLVMDIPRGSEPGWDILVQILDGEPAFEKRYRAYNEQNVLKFLMADQGNPSSIHQSIKAARENVRTTRDVLPAEVWEHVNELYLYSQEFAEKSVGRRNRYHFLDQVVGRCQVISGLVITTMCRDNSYRFMALGHMLERADMTTRIVDVGAGSLLSDKRPDAAVESLIWANLLQSLSAMSNYRRTIGPMLEPALIVDFIFKDDTLPRSLAFCLKGLHVELSQLKNHKAPQKTVQRARRRLSRFHAETASREELHQFIDMIQLDLTGVSESISESWFLPPSE
mgnify:CR=1 FL=1